MVIYNQRQSYIRELNHRQEKVNNLDNQMNFINNDINMMKNSESYKFIKTRQATINISRDQIIKKITVLLKVFRKEFNFIKLPKELIKLKRNKFKWSVLANYEIEKKIDFICIKLKEKLIDLHYKNLNILVKKLYKTKSLIESINKY